MAKFDENVEVITKEETKAKVPKKYKVILLNDDYTSMEFVVYILETIFHKTPTEAHNLMMSVHTTGSGVAGVFSFEVAEMKVAMVTEAARQNEYPLRCVLEEE